MELESVAIGDFGDSINVLTVMSHNGAFTDDQVFHADRRLERCQELISRHDSDFVVEIDQSDGVDSLLFDERYAGVGIVEVRCLERWVDDGAWRLAEA